MIDIHYFASLREALKCDSERLDWRAPQAAAVLLEQLRARGEPWSSAMGVGQRVMVAINQEIASPDSVVTDGDEVAFFPPVTGG
ncbi:molybdopterin converting factor subunit 1 [uncultured Thiodictyon sp.]|uniref:molybdopterin converting factor subunit 1 n=1 Tax=uncultured Thiodictyon sp. TaxID=1846217 RepID=UPI0025F6AE62|nr:molybdopterin converting factor subunit 1 [uncultured Thiodictyon sp.]